MSKNKKVKLRKRDIFFIVGDILVLLTSVDVIKYAPCTWMKIFVSIIGVITLLYLINGLHNVFIEGKYYNS